jgi:hypothetical protein
MIFVCRGKIHAKNVIINAAPPMAAPATPAMSPTLRPPDPDPVFEEELGVVDGVTTELAGFADEGTTAVAVATPSVFVKVVETSTTDEEAAPAVAAVASGAFEVVVKTENTPTSV